MAAGRRTALWHGGTVSKERHNASWWQLYLLGLGTVGLLVLGAVAPLSDMGHEAAMVGTLLIVAGLVEVWLRANTRPLLDVCQLVAEPQPRPEAVRETPAEESQPALASWQMPLASVAQMHAEGEPALQEWGQPHAQRA
jgi:hypothetical protein